MLTYTQNHTKHWGIVPEYASRDHAKRLPTITQDMWIQDVDGGIFADMTPYSSNDWVKEYRPEDQQKQYGERHHWSLKIDSITVATHPWLPGSLVSGITTAHFLSAYYKLPLYEVNHIMGHVFSIILDRHINILELPYLCLTVSGGHSDIYLIEEWTRKKNISKETASDDSMRHKRWHTWLWESLHIGPYTATKLVQTMDDAVGEAYDKCAKMLWGPYPWGYRMDCLAKEWTDDEYLATQLRKIVMKEQFSFSWIKSQMSALMWVYKNDWIDITENLKQNIARQFQRRTTDALIEKLASCIETYSPKTIWVVGWVSANSELRKKVETLSIHHNMKDQSYVPASLRYCVDNAAMIAVPWLLISSI